MSKFTQKQLVLIHLQKKSLTSWDAIQTYGITRLAAIICDLKDSGYLIHTTNESADGKRWARYTLLKGKK